MRLRSAGVMVGVLLAAGLLAACGNGDDENTLSKAGFQAQAAAICERTQSRISDATEGAFTAVGEIPSAEVTQRFVDDTLVPALEEELDAIEDLKEPKQDEEIVEQIIESGRTAADELTSNGVLLMNPQRNPLNRYDELSDNYGLDSCGELPERLGRKLAGVRD